MNKSLKYLLSYLKPNRFKFLQAVLAMTVSAGIQVGILAILRYVTDNISELKSKKELIDLVIIIPSIVLLKAMFQYIQAYMMSYIGQKTIQKIRYNLFSHLHSLSIEFFWRRRSGDVMARVTNDITHLQSAIHFLPLYLVRDSLTVLGITAYLFYINWKFTLIALIVGPMAAVIINILGKKMRRAARKGQATISKIYHRFQESLEGMATIKAFNYEKKAISKFSGENDNYFLHQMKYLRATVLTGPLMEFMGSIVIALLVYFGGRQIIKEPSSAGNFVVFLGAFFIGYNPLKNIARANSTYQLGMVAWNRILTLLQEKPTVIEIKDPVKPKKLTGNIKFENVTYNYPNSELNALENISFEITPGETVAFVGPSGSGKTTLINLMLRLFDPTDGTISYGREKLKNLHLLSLRNKVGLVSQNTILFDDTVTNNIALGDEDVTLDKVLSAAKAADAHNFISKMPLGYETKLGERGIKLSGGQRQRIAIARALAKQPSILFLDEATSNLDTVSEKLVQEAIEKLFGTCTLVMVAHRLSTIQNADKIYVLNHGRIAETGTHSKLIKSDGIYRKLYDIQSEAL
ncbi:MAG TPA: ABC transporter ATP-binding protein [Elusimicrobiales bacterium]|nr:ABC transporter ATP-binding protein [Elusimicrobiales bacterium]